MRMKPSALLALSLGLCLTANAQTTGMNLTGNVSAAQITSGTLANSLLLMPVNAQTGTSYAIQSSDQGKIITGSNASSQAYTIAQAGTSFPAGWYTLLENKGAGALTLTPTTSTID